jgi:hypothetical protein
MQRSLEGESSLVLISAASPIQTCVEIELKRIRLGGVGLGLERVLFRLTEKPNRLGCWLLASPLPKTNGTVQLSG